ncbi:arginine--tRNA ligase [Patescibacteria group bacterium]
MIDKAVQTKTKRGVMTSQLPVLLQGFITPGLVWQVVKLLGKVTKPLGVDPLEIKVTHPKNSDNGDLASNVALISFGKKIKQDQRSKGKDQKHKLEIKDGQISNSQTNLAIQEEENFKQEKLPQFKSPLELAEYLKKLLEKEKSPLIEKIQVAPPGFINFYLKGEAFTTQLRQILKTKEKYGQLEVLKEKRILLEHTSPDPIKTIHIGHLRNNFLGMAVSRILTQLGAQVTLDCINNDRGTHVCRAMLGYLFFGSKEAGWDLERLKGFQITDEEIKNVGQGKRWEQELDTWLTRPGTWYRSEDLQLKSDHLNLIFYSLGHRAEGLLPGVKEQVREILRAWEEEKAKVRALWRQIIDWSLSGYKLTYEKIGSFHDYVWHESNLYQTGKKLVKMGLGKGVFKASGEAVVSNLEGYGLPDTVVIKSDGTALYHTFDLDLVREKMKSYPSDLYIWDIGNDQILYLKQLFAMCEQLGIGNRDLFYHLNYGYVYLQSGQKMSSRQGQVIKADDLLLDLQKKAKELSRQVLKSKLGSKSEEKKVDSGSVMPPPMPGQGLPPMGQPPQGPAPLLVKPKTKEERNLAVALAALKYGLLKSTRENEIHFDPEKSVSLSGNSGPYLLYSYARAKSVLTQALKERILFSLSEYDLFQGSFFSGGRRGEMGFGGGFPSPFASSGRGGGLPRASLPARMGDPSRLGAPFPPSGGETPDLRTSQPKETKSSWSELETEEKRLLKSLAWYPEVILESGQKLEPAVLSQFLFSLAKAFNLFYNRHSILQPQLVPSPKQAANRQKGSLPQAKVAFEGQTNPPPNLPRNELAQADQSISKGNEGDQKSTIDRDRRFFRLALTAGVAQVLKNGLEILGIEPLEEM